MWLMLFGRLEVFPTLLMFAAAARHISKRRVAGYASVTDRR
jgi:Trk-type K+ transport system membrane component